MFVGFIRARPGGNTRLCVLWFIRVLWVRLGVSWGLSGSFGFVGVVWVPPADRRFDSGSLGSFVRAMVVVGLIRAPCGGRQIDSGSPWGSSGSFVFFVFIRVHSGVVELIRVRWFPSGTHWALLGSFGFVWSIRACPGGHRLDSAAPWG